MFPDKRNTFPELTATKEIKEQNTPILIYGIFCKLSMLNFKLYEHFE